MNDTALAQLNRLLQTPQPPGLDAGPRAHVASPRTLSESLNDFSRQHGLPARQAELLHALVLLWHDHLHAAHALVQDLPDADAALIHAIIHRREPDYWNAKYWFRRAGAHPVYPRLAAAAQELAAPAGLAEDAARFSRDGAWSAAAFVDFAQASAALPMGDSRRSLAIAIQAVESRLLLDHLLTARS